MAVIHRQATAVIVVVLGLVVVGLVRGFTPQAFGMEALVGLVAVLPVFLVVGLIWFGREVLTSVRRIESAVANDAHIVPEFTHGS